MTRSEIQEALDKLCLEMKDSLSGSLFCGILKMFRWDYYGKGLRLWRAVKNR
ncbi:hypothetical protein [Capnocytophaga gingivalis]|uniref:hypothetical protein n=1 Tax=Capnocytophaga gingivalis TaxID=1017 RepID=UPI003C76EB48